MGAGRLGTALALALAACGYEVRALVARRAGHARRAVELAGVRALALPAARLAELPPSELLFIATPDDALAGVAERVAATARVGGRVALHTSGALSSEVLAPLRAGGFRVGSMHPLAAVSDAAAGAESLRRAFYCVEGDAAAVAAARRVVRDLGGESFSIRTEDKALYHAAASRPPATRSRSSTSPPACSRAAASRRRWRGASFCLCSEARSKTSRARPRSAR